MIAERQRIGSGGEDGVDDIRRGAAEFSALAITRSIRPSARNLSVTRWKICRPALPTISPVKRIFMSGSLP
jgi:hypothetical protein